MACLINQILVLKVKQENIITGTWHLLGTASSPCKMKTDNLKKNNTFLPLKKIDFFFDLWQTWIHPLDESSSVNLEQLWLWLVMSNSNFCRVSS